MLALAIKKLSVLTTDVSGKRDCVESVLVSPPTKRPVLDGPLETPYALCIDIQTTCLVPRLGPREQRLQGMEPSVVVCAVYPIRLLRQHELYRFS